MTARCGVYVVETLAGTVVHSLRFTGIVTELIDIAVIPAARQPQMIGCRSDEIRRTVSIDG